MKQITERENNVHILLTEDQIQARVAELGAELTDSYAEKRPVCLCVLRGAVFFYADLCRHLKCPIEMDFIAASSYADAAISSGKVVIKKDTQIDLLGRDVLIIEDVVDTGLTLQALRRLLQQRGAASVKTVAFLDKPDCHPGLPGADWIGFCIPNKFIIGYGLDYADHYRNLPYIGFLQAE